MRLAIIGAQHGHVLGITRQLIAEDGVELVAVAEAEASVREETAAAFGVPGIADYRELLDGSIDAAALAPINNEKGDVAVACLESGVSVLLDKPAVTTLDDLDRLEAAAGGSAALSCALTLRFSGPYLAAQAGDRGGRDRAGGVVDGAAAAQVRAGARPAWFFDRELNGGALLDLCIHDIDGVRWLHGCEPVAVAAQHGAVRFTEYPTFADHAEAWLRLEDGGSAFVRASWLTPDSAPYHGDCRMLIEGTDGSIEIRTTAERLLHDRQGREATKADGVFGSDPGYANGGRAERAGARLHCGGEGRDGPGDFGGGRDRVAPLDAAGAGCGR